MVTTRSAAQKSAAISDPSSILAQTQPNATAASRLWATKDVVASILDQTDSLAIAKLKQLSKPDSLFHNWYLQKRQHGNSALAFSFDIIMTKIASFCGGETQAALARTNKRAASLQRRSQMKYCRQKGRRRQVAVLTGQTWPKFRRSKGKVLPKRISLVNMTSTTSIKFNPCIDLIFPPWHSPDQNDWQGRALLLRFPLARIAPRPQQGYYRFATHPPTSRVVILHPLITHTPVPQAPNVQLLSIDLRVVTNTSGVTLKNVYDKQDLCITPDRALRRLPILVFIPGVDEEEKDAAIMRLADAYRGLCTVQSNLRFDESCIQRWKNM